MNVLKKSSQFSPAVYPAIAYIHTHKFIYKFGLSVCLSVCLYPINVKTVEPIGLNFFVGHHVTTGKVYE